MDPKFSSQIGKLMIAVVAIIVAIWLAFNIVLPILKLVIPLAILILVVWFVYKVLLSESPKVG